MTPFLLSCTGIGCSSPGAEAAGGLYPQWVPRACHGPCPAQGEGHSLLGARLQGDYFSERTNVGGGGWGTPSISLSAPCSFLEPRENDSVDVQGGPKFPNFPFPSSRPLWRR